MFIESNWTSVYQNDPGNVFRSTVAIVAAAALSLAYYDATHQESIDPVTISFAEIAEVNCLAPGETTEIRDYPREYMARYDSATTSTVESARRAAILLGAGTIAAKACDDVIRTRGLTAQEKVTMEVVLVASQSPGQPRSFELAAARYLISEPGRTRAVFLDKVTPIQTLPG